MGYTGKIHDNKYWISIDRGPYFEVEEPVFRDIIRANGRTWKSMHKDGKCATSNFTHCDGDCEHCCYHQGGYNMLPIEDVFCSTDSDDATPEDIIPDDRAELVDEIVTDRLLLEHLIRRIDRLIPNGGDIFQLMAEGASEREITRALGISAQSTTNYRCKKIRSFLDENWHEFFGRSRKSHPLLQTRSHDQRYRGGTCYAQSV